MISYLTTGIIITLIVLGIIGFVDSLRLEQDYSDWK